MRVFLSSLISGFEELRDAAADGAANLGHSVVRGANPTPSSASLRASDAGACCSKTLLALQTT